YTVQPELSGFSTGVFHRDDFGVPSTGEEEDQGKVAAMEESIERIGANLQSDWVDCQRTELSEFLCRRAPSPEPEALSSQLRAESPPVAPVSPITAALQAPGGQLSPESLEWFIAQGALQPPALPTHKSTSNVTGPCSSPTKHVTAKQRKGLARSLDRAVAPDLSQARDSSPESGGQTDEDEPPRLSCRNPSNVRPRFGHSVTPQPPPVRKRPPPNSKKRLLSPDGSVIDEDALSDSPGPSISQRMMQEANKAAVLKAAPRLRPLALAVGTTPAVKPSSAPVPAPQSLAKLARSTAPPPATSTSRAYEYGLKAVYRSEFHDLFNDERRDSEFGPLPQKTKVMNARGDSEMTEDQWHACK
ncbi:hypothetical protein FRC06_011849, partial [Ceratobasidium sp. 370]